MAWSGPYNPVWANVNPDRHKAVIAHGTVMGFAFAVLFPFGAILIRTASFRKLVVRLSSDYFLPAQACFSSRQSSCSSRAVVPCASLLKQSHYSSLCMQMRGLTRRWVSGSMLPCKFLPTYWHWQALAWVFILQSIPLHRFVCSNGQGLITLES